MVEWHSSRSSWCQFSHGCVWCFAVPALATTTAMITGLISLELYKLACGFEFEKHRDAFINLGISQILFVEVRTRFDTVVGFAIGAYLKSISETFWGCGWEGVRIYRLKKSKMTILELLEVLDCVIELKFIFQNNGLSSRLKNIPMSYRFKS